MKPDTKKDIDKTVKDNIPKKDDYDYIDEKGRKWKKKTRLNAWGNLVDDDVCIGR